MANDQTPARIHLLSGLIVLGAFLAGALAGAGLDRSLRPPQGPWRPGPRGQRPPLPRHLDMLDLSTAQRDQAYAIFARHRGEIELLLRDSQPKVRAINRQMDDEFRALLSPAQQERFDELKPRPPPPGMGPPDMGPPGEPPPPPPPPY